MVKGHSESAVCSDNNMADQKMLSSPILSRGTSITLRPLCGRFRGFPAVEGLSLNEMLLSCSNIADATLISSDSIVCNPPAPAAGHICRHDVLRLQEAPPPDATVTHRLLFQHSLESDLAARWCATEGRAPGTFRNTTPNNRTLKTQMIQSMNAYVYATRRDKS